MAQKSGGGGGGKSGAIRAGGAYVEVFADDISVYRALEKLKNYLNGFGRFSRAAGVASIAAGTAVIAPVAAMFKGVVDRDVHLNRLAQRFGDTVENMSAFAYAAEATGIQLSELEDVLENLPERVDDAVNGGGEAAEVFKRMGLSAQQFMALPLSEKMAALADGLRGFGADSRNSILGKLFSDKGQKLGELFEGGQGKLRKLMAEAGQVGQVVSAEDAANAVKVDAAISRAWAAAKGVAYAIGSALLPQAENITKAADWVVSATASVRKFVEENRAMVLGVVAGGVALLGIGAGLIALGIASSALAAGVGVIASGLMAVKVAAATAIGSLLGIKAIIALVAFLVSPLGLLTAALAAVGGYLVYQASQSETAKKAATEFGQAWGFVKSTALDAWGGIKDAVAAGDLSLAFKIAVNALKVIWAGAMLGLTDKWNRFKGYFVDAWNDGIMLVRLGWNSAQGFLGDGFLALLEMLVTEFESAFAKLFGWIAKGASAIGLDSIANELNMFKELAEKGELSGVIKDARKELGSDVSKNEQQIFKERADQQAASDASRNADLAAAELRLEQAKGELAASIQEAKDAAEKTKKKTDLTKKLIDAPLIRQIAELSRGVSGARDFSKVLAVGDSINQQILRAAIDGNRKTEQVEKAVTTGADAVVEALGGLMTAT